MTYQELLQRKRHQPQGFSPKNLNPMLFDYQADVTGRALKYARCGLLLDTGMGKTFCFSEFANQVVRHNNKPAIILSPLGVTGQRSEEHTSELQSRGQLVCRL